MKKKQTDESTEFSFGDVGGFDFGSFDFETFDFEDTADFEMRYTKPKMKPIRQSFVLYDNAKKLADELFIDKGERYDIFINGSFIFGDFIEALFYKWNIKAKRCIVSTLSMSKENIDTFYKLTEGNYIDKLDLIISHYFFAHERHNLMPMIYEALDRKDRFQLAVAGIHTKTVQIETLGGRKIIIHGSANLRSSGNIEQITIEENEDLYDFYEGVFDNVLENYKTINKALRGKKLWKVMNE